MITAQQLLRNPVVFRRHVTAYGAAAVVLLALNFSIGGGAWTFWPLFVWGVALSLHFFIHRSLDVDAEWVEERVDELKYRSYDQGHIDDIEHRVEERDHSVRPADERD